MSTDFNIYNLRLSLQSFFHRKRCTVSEIFGNEKHVIYKNILTVQDRFIFCLKYKDLRIINYQLIFSQIRELCFLIVKGLKITNVN
jgi:hypothetical protein